MSDNVLLSQTLELMGLWLEMNPPKKRARKAVKAHRRPPVPPPKTPTRPHLAPPEEPELTPIQPPKPRRRKRWAAFEAMQVGEQKKKMGCKIVRLLIQRIEEYNAAIRMWKREGRPLRMRKDAPPASPMPEDAGEVEEDREWEVERLLDAKEENCGIFFQIKWKDYESPSWEPEGHLNCPALRANFERVAALSFDWDA